jgi:hypothetical protein
LEFQGFRVNLGFSEQGHQRNSIALLGRLIVEFPKGLKTVIRKAKKEIRDLKTQLEDGTLDRRKLESGLRKLQEHVREIPDHWDK